MRPVVRSLQRLIKEPMRFFILLGVVVMFLGSWRRALVLAQVPLYYMLFQSFMHTEFRYTLPMQYFLFVFAAVGWVLIWNLGLGRLLGRLRLLSRRAVAQSRPTQEP